MTRETLLTVEGISKSYPGVKANENVTFSIGVGEVHGTLGCPVDCIVVDIGDDPGIKT